jgi:hypothetical protein
MKLLTLLLLTLSANLLASDSVGQILWHTSEGIKNGGDCFIEMQSHSDLSVSEYFVTCSRTNIKPQTNINNRSKSSLVYINDNAILECPVIFARVFENGEFSILLDCVEALSFKDGFESL